MASFVTADRGSMLKHHLRVLLGIRGMDSPVMNSLKKAVIKLAGEAGIGVQIERWVKWVHLVSKE